MRKLNWLNYTGTTQSRFNGAALFQVRKLAKFAKLKFEKARFNGAALFQVRKLHALPALRQNIDGASMGPHFFKCGNTAIMSPLDPS